MKHSKWESYCQFCDEEKEELVSGRDPLTRALTCKACFEVTEGFEFLVFYVDKLFGLTLSQDVHRDIISFCPEFSEADLKRIGMLECVIPNFENLRWPSRDFSCP